MPVHFFKCFICEQIFVTGQDVDPAKLICALGQCNILEISEEEAEKIVEEQQNE